MTNPVIQEIQDRGLTSPPTTGNPIIDEITPHAGRDYDSIPMALGKAVLGGILSPITGAAGWGAELEDYMSKRFPSATSHGYKFFTGLANIGNRLQPNLAPEMNINIPTPMGTVNPQGVVDAAQMGGALIGGGVEFKGISGALDLAATKFASNITSRALTGVAKVAEGITIGARKFGASEDIARMIGNTAMLAPKQALVGAAAEMVSNPQLTPESVAKNAGLAAAFTLMEGMQYKDIPLYLYPNAAVNPRLLSSMPRGTDVHPAYVQNLLDNLGGIPDKDYDGPKTWSDFYSAVVNRNEKFSQFEKDLKKKGVPVNIYNSVTAPSSAANGTTGYITQFNGPEGTFTFDNDLNPVRTGNPGLSKIFAQIDTPEKRDMLDALLYANTLTDEGALGTDRTKFTDNKGREANLISTVKGNHYIDYPSGMKKFTDEKLARADLENNGYEQRGNTSKPPKPQEVPEGTSITDAIQSKSYITQNYPEVAQAAAGLQQYHQDLLKLLQSTGNISDRALGVYNTLLQNHISLQSFMDDGKVVSPTYSLVDNAASAIRGAIKTNILNRLTNFAEYYPAESADWIKTSRTPLPQDTPEWGVVNKVMDNLKKSGLDYVDKAGVTELVSKMGPHNITPIDDNWSAMYSYKDGYIKRYEINSDLSEAVNALNPAHINLFTQLLGLPAQALKIGTVDNPAFGIVHAIRDSYNAYLNSNYGFRLGVDSWRGFLEGIGKGKYGGAMNAERLAAGGGFGNLSDAGNILNSEDAYRSVFPRTGEQQLFQNITHPIEFMKDLTRPFLEAARIGEYMKAREAGVSAFEAAIHSRNFIGDFGMKGTSPVVQNLAYATAFMNPGMQSLNAEYNAMFGKGLKGGIGYAAKATMSIGMFTALNYAYNYWQGDDDIAKIRTTPEGSTYWYTKMPNGTILKMPKPFLPGQIFATGIEAALDKIRGENPDALKQWAKSMFEASEFSFVPTTLMEGINIYANRDSFSNRPIIPTNLEGINPQYQTTPNTSNFATAVSSMLHTATGGLVNVSPITLDYITKQTFGTLGQLAQTATGNIGNVAKETSATPFVGRFVAQYPTYAAQPIEEFYKKANDVDSVVRTTNHLYKTNQMDALNKFINENANLWAVAPIYSETKAQLNELRTALVTIENDPYISPESKKEMRNYIIQQQIQITDEVNKSVRNVTS